MQIKAILFDIDGTLVDSNDMHVIAWEEAFAGIGKRFDRQLLDDQIGKGTDMLVPTLLPNLDEAAVEARRRAWVGVQIRIPPQGAAVSPSP